MKLFKKLVALLIVAFLLIACGGSNGNNDNDPNTGSDNDDTLVVASSELNGDFINGFTNTTYDVWVKNLLHRGYEVYDTDEGGQFVLNQTVNAKEPTVEENEDGSKTFTFHLVEGLTWSDGEPITAKDYVFSILFADAPEWKNAGSSTVSGDALVGYGAYSSGESDSFEGVKYIDDTTFSLTVSGEELPYFYELALVAVGPTPMHRYVPNVTIGADGSSLATVDGYELTDADKAEYVAGVEDSIAALEEEKATLEDEDADADAIAAIDEEIAEFQALLDNVDTADVTKILLQAGAYDVAQTYRFAPDVVAGPYTFVSFENNAATVELNPEFKGDMFGKKPTIKRVVVRTVNQTLDVDLAINGEVDIVQGVIQGDKIDKAAASDQVGINTYSRNGYGFLGFHADFGSTQYKEVRQAVGYIVDRNAFVQDILGGYGVIGQGQYGLAQWMYTEKGAELEERVHKYALDFDKANELLDQSPYKFEADGTTPWDAAKGAAEAETQGDAFTYYRYNAEGEKLTIKHFGTLENNITDLINTQLPPNGRVVGLEYTVTYGDFATMIGHYQPKPNTERIYNAFNLATNFTAVFDPYYSFHSDFYGTFAYNANGLANDELDALIEEMRYLDSSETEKYADVWLEYQVLWNDLLPSIPLYSNEYRDVYNVRLKGLESTPFWDWSKDIADLTIEG